MTKKELRELLLKKNVQESTYLLDGKLYPDRFELSKNDQNIWEVYYCDERGNKHDLKAFITEEDACDFFYEYISNDSYMSQFFN